MTQQIASQGRGATLPRPRLDEDEVLDAASDCLARHGLRRTSVSDIAREMGVAPSTVYRRVGSVENAAWLVAAREGRRFLARLPDFVAGVEGPRRVTAVAAEIVASARAHPVFAKVLADEPDFIGRVVTRHLPTLLDQAVAVTSVYLEAEMANGCIRRQDPNLLAHAIIRLVAACAAASPPGDLGAFFDVALMPLL